MAVTSVVQKLSEDDELSSERMNFRTKPRIKRAIKKAVAFSGVDDSISR